MARANVRQHRVLRVRRVPRLPGNFTVPRTSKGSRVPWIPGKFYSSQYLPWVRGNFTGPRNCRVPGFPGLMSAAPSAPCPPPAKSSVSCAHVHCAPSRLSAPCQVFCLLDSCPLCPQPPVGSCPLRHQPYVSPASCPLRPQPPPAKSSVSWAHVQCAPQPPVSPLLGFQSPGLAPPEPCQPARSSVSWARVHCAFSPLSAPCRVFCLPGSCPLHFQTPVCPLPSFLSPGLMSIAPSAPCQPPSRSSVSWAHVH